MFLGRGEGVLRYFRLKILKLDKKLSDSIKKVREKKEEIGEGLRGYRTRGKEKPFQTDPARSYSLSAEEKNEESKLPEDAQIVEKIEENLEESEKFEETISSQGVSGIKVETKASKIKKGISDAFRMFNKSDVEKAVRDNKVKIKPEPIKTKTFSPTEIKVEREFYLKKKEELLIQAIVNDPRNVGLYLQLGRIYYNQKNFIDARSAFEEALRLDKTNIKAKEELKRIEKMG